MARAPADVVRRSKPRMYIRGSTPLALALSLAGCHPAATEPTMARALPAPSTTRSVALPVEVSAAELRVRFPAGWPVAPVIAPQEEHETQAVAPPTMANGGMAKLTFDVPKLPPFHMFLPIGPVTNGYIDDVKKRLPDAAGPPPTDIAVPGATARRVILTGHNAAGKRITEDAVLMVHGDHVYALVADSDAAGRPAATAALEAALASIRWSK